MPGNYRYEEERHRGQRGGVQRSGFGGRGRDDEDMEQYEGERYGGSYGREERGGEGYSRGPEGSWGRGQGGRDSLRSLGMRGDEGYEEDSYRSYTGGREGTRYGGESGAYGHEQGGRGQFRWGSQQGTQQYGGGRQGYSGQGWQGETGMQGDGGQRYGSPRYGSQQYGGQRYGGQSYGGDMGDGGRRGFGGGSGGSMQGDGWSGEPEEMQWGRQQGLYGSSEYGGYLSSQRAQRDSQSFAGRGPKGWRRSDERIREEVSEALARHPELDASEIEVKVQNGDVTLTGTVSDRRSKRLAEDVAEGIFGANDVQNQIKVQQMKGDRDVTGTAERESRGSTEGRETNESRKSTASR